MNTKLVLVGVILAVSVSLGIYFATSTSEAPSQTILDTPSLTGTIQIGGLFPLTRSLSNLGEAARAGANLAVIDFNEYLEK